MGETMMIGGLTNITSELILTAFQFFRFALIDLSS